METPSSSSRMRNPALIAFAISAILSLVVILGLSSKSFSTSTNLRLGDATDVSTKGKDKVMKFSKKATTAKSQEDTVMSLTKFSTEAFAKIFADLEKNFDDVTDDDDDDDETKKTKKESKSSKTESEDSLEDMKDLLDDDDDGDDDDDDDDGSPAVVPIASTVASSSTSTGTHQQRVCDWCTVDRKKKA